MTTANRSNTAADIPAVRPEELARFDALIGTWEMEATFAADYFGPDSPEIHSRSGRTTFEWLDGGFFLLQRFVNEHPAAPNGIAIIGATSEQESYTQHYYDSRGVARVYQTSFEGHVWRVWRAAPGFYQRYTGTVADDGSRIDGAWEGSVDGSDWRHDFDLNYIRTKDHKQG